MLVVRTAVYHPLSIVHHPAPAAPRPAAGNSPVQIHKRQFAGIVNTWYNLSIAIKQVRPRHAARRMRAGQGTNHGRAAAERMRRQLRQVRRPERNSCAPWLQKGCAASAPRSPAAAGSVRAGLLFAPLLPATLLTSHPSHLVCLLSHTRRTRRPTRSLAGCRKCEEPAALCASAVMPATSPAVALQQLLQCELKAWRATASAHHAAGT